MTEEITNNEDTIDSRDIIARIEDLQSEQDALIEEYQEAKDEDDKNDQGEGTERLSAAINALCEFWQCNPEDVADSVESLDNPADAFNGHEELHQLKKLAEEGKNYAPDWLYGAQLIAESYFQEYAEQLAEDIGAVSKTSAWPCAHIDWAAAAGALKVDYTEIDFDGTAYFIR